MHRKIAVYGGSFNPPGLHHRHIVQELCRHFDSVLVVPCGPRPEKPSNDSIPPVYRAAMADVIFSGLPQVEVDLFDLERENIHAPPMCWKNAMPRAGKSGMWSGPILSWAAIAVNHSSSKPGSVGPSCGKNPTSRWSIATGMKRCLTIFHRGTNIFRFR